MDRMIYTAMTGASESFNQQAVISHNLANASTPGFRAQLESMQAMQVQGDGLKTRTMAFETTVGADYTMGPMNSTGRQMDVAMQQYGWLAVQTKDGTEAYTKRGDLQVDRDGNLVVNGLQVLGENGPINIPLEAKVSIGPDGTISVIEPGQGAETINSTAKIKMVEAMPDQLVRGDDGLFRAKGDAQGVGAGQAMPASEDMRLFSGVLEGSNVSPTTGMVDMINAARRYEMQMKTITSANENASKANSLLGTS
ncbi:flagellar basal body rod protein FlgF [Pseudomonas aeruginosa]